MLKRLMASIFHPKRTAQIIQCQRLLAVTHIKLNSQITLAQPFEVCNQNLNSMFKEDKQVSLRRAEESEKDLIQIGDEKFVVMIDYAQMLYRQFLQQKFKKKTYNKKQKTIFIDLGLKIEDKDIAVKISKITALAEKGYANFQLQGECTSAKQSQLSNIIHAVMSGLDRERFVVRPVEYEEINSKQKQNFRKIKGVVRNLNFKRKTYSDEAIAKYLRIYHTRTNTANQNPDSSLDFDQ